jgi:hypothetical protein
MWEFFIFPEERNCMSRTIEQRLEAIEISQRVALLRLAHPELSANERAALERRLEVYALLLDQLCDRYLRKAQRSKAQRSA